MLILGFEFASHKAIVLIVIGELEYAKTVNLAVLQLQ